MPVVEDIFFHSFRLYLWIRGLALCDLLIAEQILPMDRGEKYERPLSRELEGKRLGRVVGAGTMMTSDKTIAWVQLDLELKRSRIAIESTRSFLLQLGVPRRSCLIIYDSTPPRKVPIHPEDKEEDLVE